MGIMAGSKRRKTKPKPVARAAAKTKAVENAAKTTAAEEAAAAPEVEEESEVAPPWKRRLLQTIADGSIPSVEIANAPRKVAKQCQRLSDGWLVLS